MHLDRLKTAAGLDLRAKRVLVRADLNVPMHDGKVSDATRLQRLVPGIEDLAARGAKVIVISHLGRPKHGPDPQYSLRPVAEALAQLLAMAVAFAPDCVGEAAAQVISRLQPGGVGVLENLRFHQGEEKNDPLFAKQLARLADLYIGDAFSSAHRAHASTEAITRLLPSYAGPLLMEEIDALRSVLDRPRRPTLAVIGGAKVSTKLPVLNHLLEQVDALIIGGGMANTFLLAQGHSVGNSLAEPDLAEAALEILAAASEHRCEVVLPSDVVVAAGLQAGAPSRVCAVAATPGEQMILDVGPQTITQCIHLLRQSKTLLWNGPLGAFEVAPFGEGTFALAREAAALTRTGKLTSVAGGGDTVAALNAAGVTEAFSYVSTAGGAFLEWLEGRPLPGIVALAAAAR